jgi:hypothetical protein
MSTNVSLLNRSIRPRSKSHSGLSDAERFCRLGPLEPFRPDGLLDLDKKICAKEQMLGFFVREAKITKDVAGRQCHCDCVLVRHADIAPPERSESLAAIPFRAIRPPRDGPSAHPAEPGST